jgi:hypothetical protein
MLSSALIPAVATLLNYRLFQAGSARNWTGLNTKEPLLRGIQNKLYATIAALGGASLGVSLTSFAQGNRLKGAVALAAGLGLNAYVFGSAIKAAFSDINTAFTNIKETLRNISSSD